MWKSYLIETMSGRIGAEVEMSTNGRWDIRLNMTESATVTVQKSSLAGIPRRWFSPWRGGVLVTFTDDDGVETPWLAGPIASPPDEYEDSLSFRVRGIRAVLDKRILISSGYWWNPAMTMDQHVDTLKKHRVTYTNTSLGHIAQDVVRLAMLKEGGQLPIVFPRPAEVNVPGGHARTYYGYDFANNNVDKILGQLSDVANGPDIMFRPRWADEEHTRIEWAMLTGNEASPVIPQDWIMDIDTTAPYSQVSEFSLNVDGDHYATRAWASGTGEGEGIAAAMSEQIGLLGDNMPLLETAASYPSVSRTDTLYGYARAATDIRALVECDITVDGSDPRSMYRLWRVGDKARVTVDGLLSVPKGTHELRIGRAAGDFDSPHAILYFQEDQW